MSNVKKKFILANLVNRDFKGWYSFIYNINELTKFNQMSYMCTIYIAKLNSLFEDLFISLQGERRREVDLFFDKEQNFLIKVSSCYTVFQSSYLESFRRRDLFKKLINRYAFRNEYAFHQSIYFVNKLIGFSNFAEQLIITDKKKKETLHD